MPDFIQPGQSLFKFLSPASEKFDAAIEGILGKHEFYLSSPDGFNDPFDAAPVVRSNLRVEQVQARFNYLSADPWSKDLSNEQVARILLAKEKNIDWNKFAVDMNARLSSSTFDLKKRVGVTCFTERADNLLLWSHYAGQHTGICLEFKRGTSKASGLRFAGRVQYAENRPMIEIGDIFDIVDLIREGKPYQDKHEWERYVDVQFFTKSVDWGYEQEWRIALADTAGRSLRYEQSELCAIFLGVRSEPALEQRIRSIVASSVPVYRMKLHDEEFGVYPTK